MVILSLPFCVYNSLAQSHEIPSLPAFSCHCGQALLLDGICQQVDMA